VVIDRLGRDVRRALNLIGDQLVHALFLAIVIAFASHNRYSVDRLLVNGRLADVLPRGTHERRWGSHSVKSTDEMFAKTRAAATHRSLTKRLRSPDRVCRSRAPGLTTGHMNSGHGGVKETSGDATT
jgi:hypothetical protein